MDPTAEEVNPLYSLSLASHLVSLYKTNTITDISIKCGDEDFDLHSPVLSHGSNYFRTVLSTQVEPQINLDFEPPIQAPTFRIIVDSLYTGVVNDIAEENVTDILEGSHHLQVKHATDACVNFMIRHLNTENCLQYWLSARLCDNKKVKDAAIGLIGRHLDLVSKTPLFLALEADVVVEILSDDELQVPSEVHAYESAMGWLKYDSEGRRKHLSDVLNSIRLDLLPVNYLVNVVGKEDMIEENSVTMKMYTKALKNRLGKVKTDVKSRGSGKGRKSESIFNFL
uniref:BTB domain-containing protein n=1 Tax=Chaetoceros debilis TaxID=122233 RepID=A0A7S3V951_9STRA